MISLKIFIRGVFTTATKIPKNTPKTAPIRRISLLLTPFSEFSSSKVMETILFSPEKDRIFLEFSFILFSIATVTTQV